MISSVLHSLKSTIRVFSAAMVAGPLILCLMLMDATKTRAASPIGYQQLYAFKGGPADGEYLYDSIIEGSDGRLYGTTVNGGPDDGGLVFGMNKDGSGYAILHPFRMSTTDGLSPWGGVVQGSDGRLYGRTLSGGTNDGSAVFGLNKNGSGYTVLHSFTSNLPDHMDSYSGLIQGSDGALYGTTFNDGALGRGSVFRLNKDGAGFQTLHSFQDNNSDGGFPYGTVHEASDGVLYGTTSEGGPDDYGTLYQVNRDGAGYV